MATGYKAPDALKTIGELSNELGVAQHILRYWETRFPQLKPMQRAGNRRYYRPEDVELVRRINRLLNEEGYTVRGVQKVLRDKGRGVDSEVAPSPEPEVPASPQPELAPEPQPSSPAAQQDNERTASGIDLSRIKDIRDRLVMALRS